LRPDTISIDGIVEETGVQENTVIATKSTMVNASTKSQGIAEAYLNLLNAEDGLNPAVGWNEILKPLYIQANDDYTQQSWRSASGTAFEEFLATYYTDLFPGQYRVNSHGRNTKERVVEILGVADEITREKIDLTVEVKFEGEWRILGCPHVKTSLRERISDLKSASLTLQKKNIFSPILTLDAQYELGGAADQVPNLGRSLVEEKGVFSAMYCYNTAVEPTIRSSPAARVKRVDLPSESDVFMADVKSVSREVTESELRTRTILPGDW